jgi:4-amino-4-deoxy-L-arabinose transferase-like glycosyltransferase
MRYPARPARFLIPLLTLLAFWLRLFALSRQSYWLDEAWTLYFADISLADLWHWLRTEELHPPLYFPLMNFWVRLVGNSEFSTRFVSAVFSTVTIPLIYRLGQTLGSRWVGVIAALLMAVAPYQVWHGQDARNYSMLAAATTMSMWSFVMLWQRKSPHGRWWLVYIFSTMWAIMTHYHGLVVIGIQGLFLLVTIRRRGRRVVVWTAATVAVLLPLAVWLSVGPDLLASSHWLTLVSLPVSYWRGAVAYSIGELVPAPQKIYLTLPFLLLYGVGLVYATQRRWGRWQGWEMLVLLLAFTLAPNVAAWVYSLLRTPIYLERYLIPVQTGYLLAIAVGLLAVADVAASLLARATHRTEPALPDRWTAIGLATVALLVLTGISGWVLAQYYFNPVYARPDWRAVAAKVAAFEQPGDGVIITGDNGDKAFNYYYHGTAPLYLDFNTPVPTPADARERLAEISSQQRRLWFSPYGAPIDQVVEEWLLTHSYPAWQSWLGRKRLALYYVATDDLLRQERLDHPVANGLVLASVALPDKATPAGDLLPLALTWEPSEQPPADLQLSMRLINQDSDVFAQSDWPPLNRVTSAGSERQVIDRRSLWLPADLPPGSYLLQFLVYDTVNGQPGGTPAFIAGVEVGPARIIPPIAEADAPNFVAPAETDAPVSLVGYAAPETIQPGQQMWLWLFWLANREVAADTTLTVTLGNNQATVATTVPITAMVGATAEWLPGQVRRGVLHVPTTPHLPGDRADITVTVNEPGQEGVVFQVEAVELQGRERLFTSPVPAYPLEAKLGRPAAAMLLGVDMPATTAVAGERLPVTIYWQARAEFETNYTVFLQLLSPKGQVVTQIDAQPQNGAAPTTTWLTHEVITDPYQLTLPTDLPPGPYQLIAGLYNAQTGGRLPVDSGGDFVQLPAVTVR